MGATLDMEGLERRAYQTLWEDGLIDVISGVGLLAMGTAWIMHEAALGAIFPAILVPVWSSAHRRLSAPRVGVVEFAPERRGRERKKQLVLALIGVLCLALGVAVYSFGRPTGEVFRAIVPGLPAALLGLGAGLVGAMCGIRRFLLYAAAMVVIGALGAGLGVRPGWHLLSGGVIVTVSGIAVLVSYLHRYPVDDPEASA